MAPWHLSLAAWNTEPETAVGCTHPRGRPRMRTAPAQIDFLFRGGHVDIKKPSGRSRGLSALHNTASDGPLIEKDQATAKANARRMGCDYVIAKARQK